MEKATAILAMPSEGLGLLRRGLGLLCLVDACLRLPSAVFWLTDLGVLPRSLYFRLFEDSLSWSVFSISGRPEFVFSLLLLTALLGAAQLAGRSNRWVRVALWVLILSVQNRNPGVMESSDYFLRLLLFWDIFLPDTLPPGDYLSPATLGLQLQVSLAAGALAWHLTEQGWQQAAAWSLAGRVFAVPWIWMAVKIFLVVLAVTVWIGPLRILALLAGVPVLVAWGAVGEPFLPLTFLVALSSLYRNPKGENELKFGEASRLAMGGAILVYFLIISQSVAGLSEFAGGALGLEQQWSRSYPPQETEVVELLARGAGGEVLWALDVNSHRRARLWAQEVGRNKVWAARLTDALRYKLEFSTVPTIWLRKSQVGADQTLGPTELELLSDTPVRGDTRGEIEP